MASDKKFFNLYKLFSLISVIRGYNILVLVIAQYLASIYIFSSEKSFVNVALDLHLFFVIFSNVCVIAGGYIINNFYDVKADKINRPFKAGLDNFVRQETRLKIYFALNLIAVLFGLLVSWRAALFFSINIFAIWLYSHKLKRYPLAGLISVTTLTILPFFIIFVYFKNFSKIIFVHAVFLYLVIMVRELVKDLENMKGAVVNNYKTFPVVYGERNTKLTCLALLCCTLIPIFFLLSNPAISYMRYYFYFTLFSLVIIGGILLKSTKKQHFTIIHLALKILLLVGVLSIVLIDTSLLVDKVMKSFY